MAFNQSLLLQTLSALPSCERLWVAYSGGMDSHVLLHAVLQVREQLAAQVVALHVNHGLQKQAHSWAERCSAFCSQHEIPITILEVDATHGKGESPEATARDSRYSAIADMLREGDILLTAHHSDDQAETVLLQLLRGSGPSGLSGMPMINGFGPGFHARPLLEHSRADLAEYARNNHLEWLEDFSNRDISFDRNYLRHEVIPLLRQRWPALDRTLSRSASHCAEAQLMIEQAARIDLQEMQLDQNDSMSITALAALPPPRARAVIRTWIRDTGLILPDTARLDRVLREMISAREDRNPMVDWPGVELRRYRDRLYLMPALQDLDQTLELEWDGCSPLVLPSALGILYAESAEQGISAYAWESGNITISFRAGGERCRPLGRSNSKSLKNLFQERAIPPWQRGRIPLVKIDNVLAAVGDIWLCDAFKADSSETAVRLRWERCPG
ncbi:MAG: tRNA lysidine(34) synthetase TilS [Gammaproteobacteria bacterium]